MQKLRLVSCCDHHLSPSIGQDVKLRVNFCRGEFIVKEQFLWARSLRAEVREK